MQRLYSDDGRVSFDNPEQWYLSTSKDDISSTNILTVENGNPMAGVIFKKGKVKARFASLNDISYQEKSLFKDDILRLLIGNLKLNGDVRINKTDIYNDSIAMGFTVKYRLRD